MSSAQQPVGAEHPMNTGGANRPGWSTQQERMTTLSPSTVPAVEETGLGNVKGPAGLAVTSGGPPNLGRRSAADILGPGSLDRASVQKFDVGTGRVSAPDATEEAGSGKGIGGMLKKAWHEVKEITPGTKEHEAEFGSRWTTGTYASTYGKRQTPSDPR